MSDFDALDKAVIAMIKKRADNGVDPEFLIGRLMKAGASRRDAQLAIQRALDEGTAGLGAEMRVYPGTRAAA